MNSNFYKIPCKKEQLWQGCILASIAHAIMVAHYPEMSNEHSWDGMNYSTQDSSGTRGTITFSDKYYVGAFRNDNSERLNNKDGVLKYIQYFNGVPQDIIKLSEEEALQYLLEDINGKTIPVITTAFWGDENDGFSNDKINDFKENGGFLLEVQMMEIDKAINEWKEYYEMTQKQVDLLISIYKRKENSPNEMITLSEKEIDKIGTEDKEGLYESKISFEEIGIQWEN